MKYYPLVTATECDGAAAVQRREVLTETFSDGAVVTVICPATAPATHRALVVYFRLPDGDNFAALLAGPRYGAGVYHARAERVEGPTRGWVYTVDEVGREVARALCLAVPDPSTVGRGA